MDLDKIGTSIAGFVTAILGVAIVAVILSQGANTVNVIGTFFSGLSSLLSVVLSPVTGGSNFALGAGQTGAYQGEVTLGGGYTTGSSGISLNGLGSLNLSNSAINSLLGSGSSGSGGSLIGGNFDSGTAAMDSFDSFG